MITSNEVHDYNNWIAQSQHLPNKIWNRLETLIDHTFNTNIASAVDVLFSNVADCQAHPQYEPDQRSCHWCGDPNLTRSCVQPPSSEEVLVHDAVAPILDRRWDHRLETCHPQCGRSLTWSKLVDVTSPGRSPWQYPNVDILCSMPFRYDGRNPSRLVTVAWPIIQRIARISDFIGGYQAQHFIWLRLGGNPCLLPSGAVFGRDHSS